VPVGVEVSEKSREIRRQKKNNIEPMCDTLADCVSFYQAAPFRGFQVQMADEIFNKKRQ